MYIDEELSRFGDYKKRFFSGASVMVQFIFSEKGKYRKHPFLKQSFEDDEII